MKHEYTLTFTIEFNDDKYVEEAEELKKAILSGQFQRDMAKNHKDVKVKATIVEKKNKKSRIDDNLPLTSIPRDLCKTCYDWCSQEDVCFNDIPQCANSDICCKDYLNHIRNDCPKHIEL